MEHRASALLGSIIATLLQASGHDWENASPKAGLGNLHSFPIAGDYYEVNFSLGAFLKIFTRFTDDGKSEKEEGTARNDKKDFVPITPRGGNNNCLWYLSDTKTQLSEDGSVPKFGKFRDTSIRTWAPLSNTFIAVFIPYFIRIPKDKEI